MVSGRWAVSGSGSGSGSGSCLVGSERRRGTMYLWSCRVKFGQAAPAPDCTSTAPAPAGRTTNSPEHVTSAMRTGREGF
jgi:hypothetical protein